MSRVILGCAWQWVAALLIFLILVGIMVWSVGSVVWFGVSSLLHIHYHNSLYSDISGKLMFLLYLLCSIDGPQSRLFLAMMARLAFIRFVVSVIVRVVLAIHL